MHDIAFDVISSQYIYGIHINKLMHMCSYWLDNKNEPVAINNCNDIETKAKLDYLFTYAVIFQVMYL